MNRSILILVMVTLFCFHKTCAQRYLDNVFTGVDSVTNISYGSAPDYLHKTQGLLFDFYEPHNDSLKMRPLLIYVHGGGFAGGTRKWPSIRLICEKMALKGYAVASIDYRLDPTFNVFRDSNKRAMTDAMHDLKAAIRFFKLKRSEYRIDTGKIFVGGESAGAVTAMMATYIDKEKELISYVNANPDNVEGVSGSPGINSKPNAALCLCGFGDTLAIETANDPPFLWIHGSADPLVNIELARNVLIKADKINLPYQTYIFQGATHCPWYYGLPNWQSYLDTTVELIANFLYPYTRYGAFLKPFPDLNDTGVVIVERMYCSNNRKGLSMKRLNKF